MSYPVLSSHKDLQRKQLELLDVGPATIRLSVGIEDAADLIADLEQALGRFRGRASEQMSLKVNRDV